MTTTATFPSALELAAAVRVGRRTAVNVVREHLTRIAELDPELNAFQVVRGEAALAEAAAMDTRPDRGRLPLAGVPVAVKDNIAVAGEEVRHGSAATIRRSRADRDDLLVERLRAAGGVVVGTTRMPELAAWAFTASAAFGITRNPWDPALDPGGSTGGGAAAVAAGMAALAIGTDGGGSLRIPAAYCGLVGVKPSTGLVPLPDGLTEHWCGLTVAGPIARTAADAAAALAVLTGRDGPTKAPEPEPGRLRVAVSLRSPSPLARPDSRSRTAVLRAEEALRAAGCAVRRDDPPYPATLLQTWGRYWHAGIALDADRLGLDSARLEPRTAAMTRKGLRVLRRGGPSGAAAWRNRAERWFEPHDIVVSPVVARGPGQAGGLDGRGYLATYLASARSVPYTQAWNLAGFPAVTVPVGVRDGLPLAVQLVGRPDTEPVLLAVASWIEAGASPTRRTNTAPPDVGAAAGRGRRMSRFPG
jgi:amidase